MWGLFRRARTADQITELEVAYYLADAEAAWLAAVSERGGPGFASHDDGGDRVTRPGACQEGHRAGDTSLDGDQQ